MMRPPFHTFRPFRCAAAWGLSWWLAGCSFAPSTPNVSNVSNVSDAAPVSSYTARRNAPLKTYVVEITDGVFHEKTLLVQAGVRVKLELLNHGPGPLEFENAEMNVEKIVNAGVRSFVVLAPLAPGKYEFVDEFNPVSGVIEIHAQ